MAGKFEIYKDKAGEFRFRLKASNGQNILGSEGYAKKASCMNGVESVRKNSQNPKRFEINKTPTGKWTFRLLAANGQTIGTSQTYASESGCRSGTGSVARSSAEATVDDQT
ncbi:MAG: YegP family protein [Pseudomonadota bacterium]|nr:MAG: YegP family protein [Pseudomonadota bacterium]